MTDVALTSVNLIFNASVHESECALGDRTLMGFFRGIAAAARAVQEGRELAQAYTMVRSFFVLDVSSQSIAESRRYLETYAGTASVPEIALEYLNWYGRRVIKHVEQHPEEAAEARAQFERFALKVSLLKQTGVSFSSVFLGPFEGIVERLAAD